MCAIAKVELERRKRTNLRDDSCFATLLLSIESTIDCVRRVKRHKNEFYGVSFHQKRHHRAFSKNRHTPTSSCARDEGIMIGLTRIHCYHADLNLEGAQTERRLPPVKKHLQQASRLATPGSNGRTSRSHCSTSCGRWGGWYQRRRVVIGITVVIFVHHMVEATA